VGVSESAVSEVGQTPSLEASAQYSSSLYQQHIDRFRDHDAKAMNSATISGVILGLITSGYQDFGTIPPPLTCIFVGGLLFLAASLFACIFAMILVEIPVPTSPSHMRERAYEGNYDDVINEVAAQYSVGYESYTRAILQKARFVKTGQVCLLIGVALSIVSVLI